MKYIIVSIIISVFLNAEDINNQSYNRSIQFGITEKFTLGEFEGSLLSYTKQISKSSAIRFGLGGDISHDVTDRESYYDDLDQIDRLVEGKSNRVFFEIITQRMRYSKLIDNIRPYYGVGPILTSYIRSGESTEKRYFYNPDSTDLTYSSQYDYSIGFGAISTLGAEWFIRNNISLIAEYGISVVFAYTKHETLRKSDKDGYYNSRYIKKSKDIDISPRTINFGLAFHFK